VNSQNLVGNLKSWFLCTCDWRYIFLSLKG